MQKPECSGKGLKISLVPQILQCIPGEQCIHNFRWWWKWFRKFYFICVPNFVEWSEWNNEDDPAFGLLGSLLEL